MKFLIGSAVFLTVLTNLISRNTYGAAPMKEEVKTMTTALSSRVKAHVIRLKPGQDLLAGIKDFAKQKHLKAASIISAVGSLTRVTLRYANQPSGTSRDGHFEIVSLSGMVSEDSVHLHASVSDSAGATMGGHLTGENKVYTTVELAIAEYEDIRFTREKDPTFGYDELVVKPRD
ncbi:MAG: DNA-binding protein [Proteobacteria bacterium]|nr:DNA-binding protein [Pseudomonadota bacterium]